MLDHQRHSSREFADYQAEAEAEAEVVR